MKGGEYLLYDGTSSGNISEKITAAFQQGISKI